jgi:hypothetical protein
MTDVKFEGKGLVSDVDISSKLRLWASKYSNISPMMNSKGFWKKKKHNLKIDILALVININSFMVRCTTLCDKVCQWLDTTLCDKVCQWLDTTLCDKVCQWLDTTLCDKVCQWLDTTLCDKVCQWLDTTLCDKVCQWLDTTLCD